MGIGVAPSFTAAAAAAHIEVTILHVLSILHIKYFEIAQHLSIK